MERQTVKFSDGKMAIIDNLPDRDGVFLNGCLMPGWKSIEAFIDWVRPAWEDLGLLPVSGEVVADQVR